MTLTRSLPEQALQKIVKIIPRLSSPEAGERLGCVLAIDRILAVNDSSWSELAELLTSERGDHQADGDEELSDLEETEIDIGYCLRSDYRRFLFENEIDFLETLELRVVSGIAPSEKQAAWLEKILARIARKRQGEKK